MKTYAVIENNLVANIIVADSLELAEKVTSSVCVYITEATGNAHVGLKYENGTFEQPTPIIVEP